MHENNTFLHMYVYTHEIGQRYKKTKGNKNHEGKANS